MLCVWCGRGRHVRIVELLLDFGADPTMETYKKHSPLRVRPIPCFSCFFRVRGVDRASRRL